MALASDIRQIVANFVEGKLSHEAFQKEFASMWSAVSESDDSYAKWIAYRIQAELSLFVDDFLPEQGLKLNLSRLLPAQLYTTTVKIETKIDEKVEGTLGSGSSNDFDYQEAWEFRSSNLVGSAA